MAINTTTMNALNTTEPVNMVKMVNSVTCILPQQKTFRTFRQSDTKIKPDLTYKIGFPQN